MLTALPDELAVLVKCVDGSLRLATILDGASKGLQLQITRTARHCGRLSLHGGHVQRNTVSTQFHEFRGDAYLLDRVSCARRAVESPAAAAAVVAERSEIGAFSAPSALGSRPRTLIAQRTQFGSTD